MVLGAAKLGNYVVLQPLLRGLREKVQGADLTYVGSRRTSELEINNPSINRSLPLAEQGRGGHRATEEPAGRGPGDQCRWAQSPHPELGERPGAPLCGGCRADSGGDHPLQQLALDPYWARADLVER